MSKKNRKRLDALSEVVFEDEQKKSVSVASTPTEGESNEPKAKEDYAAEKNAKQEGEGGIFGKVKDLYDKADAMAQSQALLLNKELEDRGVVEKITDETGLKVIGKDAAAKLEINKGQKSSE